MRYLIETNSDTPAYIQLYRYFVKDIITGVYPYDSKLPSKRTIADDTGVSVITVEHAMTLLNEEGYVQSRQRSGVYVTYRGEDFLGDNKTDEEIVYDVSKQNHSTGEFPYSVLAKTMRKVLLDYGEKILVKSPNHGCPELRGEISAYLKRSRGLHVRPNQIIIGSGSEYLYGLIVQMLGTDKTYAIEKPSYNKIRQVYEAMGISCDQLLMTPSGIATEELERTEAKILHVTPFNSFPTGVTADISKRQEYLRWARKRKGILIEDNYDSELTISRKSEEPLYSMSSDVNVIYLNTFSRTIAPSMRIGYMVLPVGMVEEYNRKLGFYSCTVPIFDQYVLANLLKNGDFERHINRMRRKIRQLKIGKNQQ